MPGRNVSKGIDDVSFLHLNQREFELVQCCRRPAKFSTVDSPERAQLLRPWCFRNAVLCASIPDLILILIGSDVSLTQKCQKQLNPGVKITLITHSRRSARVANSRAQ